MLKLPQEIFRPVRTKFDTLNRIYIVGNYGTIKNTVTGCVLSRRTHKKGYSRACLCVDGYRYEFRWSHLVAWAFPEICGEWFEGAEVDHINGFRGDDRAANIQVVNHKSNINNPITIYRHKKKVNHQLRDLPENTKK